MAWTVHHTISGDWLATATIKTFEQLRAIDVARFQLTAEELHDANAAALLSLHVYWRREGYPADYIERQLATTLNLMRVPHNITTAVVSKVMTFRELDEV
ncbi:MAG: hypothetical protein P8N02_03080 [Actinomycetota bacterium]|jgi:hypothetical protein|nr:hypothetical protein [Actinomycetota bacterium]